jgi:ribosomal protein S18 acetylase RimI-like enzyme
MQPSMNKGNGMKAVKFLSFFMLVAVQGNDICAASTSRSLFSSVTTFTTSHPRLTKTVGVGAAVVGAYLLYSWWTHRQSSALPLRNNRVHNNPGRPNKRGAVNNAMRLYNPEVDRKQVRAIVDQGADMLWALGSHENRISSVMSSIENLKASTYVFCQDNVVKGFVTVEFRDNSEDHIYFVGVGEQFRGQGIGEQILRHAFAYICKPGHTITISVQPANRAKHLYERLGFVFPAVRGYSPMLVHGTLTTT